MQAWPVGLLVLDLRRTEEELVVSRIYVCRSTGGVEAEPGNLNWRGGSRQEEQEVKAEHLEVAETDQWAVDAEPPEVSRWRSHDLRTLRRRERRVKRCPRSRESEVGR